MYQAAINEVRETDQQIHITLENSILYAQQNKVRNNDEFCFYSEFIVVVFFSGFENGFSKNKTKTIRSNLKRTKYFSTDDKHFLCN